MPRGIYTDNDSGDHVVVKWLRAHGHEVTTSVEAGRTRAPDPEQLRFCDLERMGHLYGQCR